MKKVLLFGLMAIGFSNATFAQAKGDVEFGANIGFNYSTVSNREGSSDSGYGFNAGASAEYYFSDRWGIKTRVIYDQKGWNNGFVEDENGVRVSADINLNYITVPLMANYHFGAKRNWYLHFGPYVGFLVDAEETTFNSDVTDNFNENDFGLAYGIGVKIPVSDKLKIFFEFDGQGGFNDIYKQNPDFTVSNGRGSLNFGINFLLK